MRAGRQARNADILMDMYELLAQAKEALWNPVSARAGHARADL